MYVHVNKPTKTRDPLYSFDWWFHPSWREIQFKLTNIEAQVLW